ncbi:beta-lactamase family protein [Niveomyces insectorum RCEF 264]|uniref:Beta-lactamase family protein n=1 Tax=Niveomyces insectorum RCEF 264 TaxID=1081102 RepID=A0A167QHK9_9HYPO|nr:beta-lactamase family protein [Niveomyces insectorum RCEF 264]
MASFDEVITKAVDDRVIPGVFLLAENKSGSFHYERVLGRSSLEPGNEQPLRRDHVFAFMSASKLPTAVVVLQAVEQGLWDLDADVAPVLPELAALPVLAGFDGDGPDAPPVLVPRTTPITLRLLLTHSAGVFRAPPLVRYCAYHKIDAQQRMTGSAVSVESRFDYPLLFQPGEGWNYGAGIDWAGRLVERLHAAKTGQAAEADAVTLEDLFVRGVLAPLGFPAGVITFHPERYPDVRARLWPSLPGLYGELTPFLHILLSLLRDDSRLLRPETAALLFTPQLAAPVARQQLLANTVDGAWITGSVPNTGEYDWSLGGLLVTGHAHPVRRKGALLWAGAFNLTWIIDREAGVAAVFGSNFAPPGDKQGKALMGAWEEYIFPLAAQS